MGAKLQTLTRAYVGASFEEAGARFEADRVEAARHGWYVRAQYWDDDQPGPMLVVVYQDRPVTTPSVRRGPSLRIIGLYVAALIIAALVIAIALMWGDQSPAAGPSRRASPLPAVLGLPSAKPRAGTPPPVSASARPPGATPAPPATPGKYEQTWTLPYSQTTCHDWMNEMDAHERFVMAAHMLATERLADGAMEDPPDRQVRSLRNAINGFCREEGVDSRLIPEVAAAIYLLADDLKP